MKFTKKLSILTTAFWLTCVSQATPFILETAKESGKVTTDLVRAGDKFVTLLGTQVAVGQIAPNFRVVNEQFAPVQLSDFKNKTVLISVVPSLDTGVCSIQTKRFNDELSQFDENVIALTISNDLPFAQKRFCQTEKIERVQVLSDSVWRNFGEHYGLLIKDMGLLTRAIFIIDPEGRIAYKELVENISSHPNYEEALARLQVLTETTHTDKQVEVAPRKSEAIKPSIKQ